jgi:CBS domain containing-hemolysin-like protein
VVRYETPARQALEELESGKQKIGVVLRGDKPAGYVTPKLLKYETGAAGEAAEPFPLVVEDQAPLRDVLSDMLMEGMAVYCVVDKNGDFVGTITYQNIQHHILELFKEENGGGD